MHWYVSLLCCPQHGCMLPPSGGTATTARCGGCDAVMHGLCARPGGAPSAGAVHHPADVGTSRSCALVAVCACRATGVRPQWCGHSVRPPSLPLSAWVQPASIGLLAAVLPTVRAAELLPVRAAGAGAGLAWVLAVPPTLARKPDVQFGSQPFLCRSWRGWCRA